MQMYMCSYVVVNMCLVRQIDMWFSSSVVECRDSVPEVLDSNPGRARYFFTTCYISARGPTHSPSNSRLPVIYFLFYDLVYFQTNPMVTWSSAKCSSLFFSATIHHSYFKLVYGAQSPR